MSALGIPYEPFSAKISNYLKLNHDSMLFSVGRSNYDIWFLEAAPKFTKTTTNIDFDSSEFHGTFSGNSSEDVDNGARGMLTVLFNGSFLKLEEVKKCMEDLMIDHSPDVVVYFGDDADASTVKPVVGYTCDNFVEIGEVVMGISTYIWWTSVIELEVDHEVANGRLHPVCKLGDVSETVET